jgi:hypothetical protein
MRGTAAWIAVLGASALFAGCLDSGGSVLVLPYVAVAPVAPGGNATFAYFLQNGGDFAQDANAHVDPLPTGWNATLERSAFSLLGHNSTTLLLNVSVPPLARRGLQSITLHVGDGQVDVSVDVTDLPADSVAWGEGAHVFVVGFRGNGSVFYSNWANVLQDSSIPRLWLDANGTIARNQSAVTTNTTALRLFAGNASLLRSKEAYLSAGYAVPSDALARLLVGMRPGETRAVRLSASQGFETGIAPTGVGSGTVTFLLNVESVDSFPAQPINDSVNCPPLLCRTAS